MVVAIYILVWMSLSDTPFIGVTGKEGDKSRGPKQWRLLRGEGGLKEKWSKKMRLKIPKEKLSSFQFFPNILPAHLSLR